MNLTLYAKPYHGIMECMCKNVWIRVLKSYGEACRLLSIKNKDCTVVDVGCGMSPTLHELQRHLREHGVKCHTVGIDITQPNKEVDEFIHSNILDVDLHDVADIVIGVSFFPQFKDRTSWKKAVRISANMLKTDGILIIDIESRVTWRMRLLRLRPDSDYKKMTKEEALQHAEQCFNACLEKCPHGETISRYVWWE